MPYADLEEFRLFYGEYGEGEPLVFLHGFTLDRRMWEAQAEYFSQFYRVFLVDARGHGLSDAPQSGYSRAHRVKDLRQFADIMQLERFHLVGLSMGGSTAIGTALKYPERLRSVTLVSSGAAGYSAGKKFCKLDDMAREKGYEAVRERWMQMSLGWFKDGQEEIRDLIGTMMGEHTGAPWMDPMRGKYPREIDLDRVHEIKTPTLIITGEKDRIFSTLGQKLREKIPGSRLLVYEGVGHMVNLEAPDRINADLKVFFEEAEKGMDGEAVG